MVERAEEVRKGKAEMVRKLVRILNSRDYDDMHVAGLEEFASRRPAVVHWEGADTRFAPDVTARRKEVNHLFQVETATTLQVADAAEKTALFAAFAEHFRLQFCLVVPESCRQEGQKCLHNLRADERFSRLLVLP